MAKPKTKKPQNEDEAQSHRFIEAAKAAEVDGGLSPAEAERVFEATVGKVLRPKSTKYGD